eukprot:6471354-Amphidinium_carterae.1
MRQPPQTQQQSANSVLLPVLLLVPAVVHATQHSSTTTALCDVAHSAPLSDHSGPPPSPADRQPVAPLG